MSISFLTFKRGTDHSCLLNWWLGKAGRADPVTGVLSRSASPPHDSHPLHQKPKCTPTPQACLLCLPARPGFPPGFGGDEVLAPTSLCAKQGGQG